MRGNGCSGSSLQKSEISRLLSAAVVNQHFCDLLLADPEAAVSAGYLGEPFLLEKEEKVWIASIRAKSLADFALQLASGCSGLNGHLPPGDRSPD